MGRMPYVDLIYRAADTETKKNLKKTSMAFWEAHRHEKFTQNFSPAQNKSMSELYCFGDCPNLKTFEVKYKLIAHTKIIFRIVSSHRYVQQIAVNSVFRGMPDGWILGQFLAGKTNFHGEMKRSPSGADAIPAGKSSASKDLNITCKYCTFSTVNKLILKSFEYLYKMWIK